MQSVKLNRSLTWLDGLLLLAALILLTYGIGRYGLFEPHEGHFAGVAREMILRGDWVTPTLNGAPYLNKPPLLYWLIATSYKVFGIQEFAARLPIALAGWAGVVLAWLWSRQLWGAIAARSVVILLSTSVGWFIFAHQLLIDELLGTLLLGVMYGLWRLTLQPKSQIWFVVTYVLLGLAILAKGILALPFWIIGCGAIALTHRRWQILRLFRPVLGLVLSAVVVIPWFIAVERANSGFVQYFLFNENFKRALDTRWPPDYSISKISPWGYVLVSALWCLPWILLLPPALGIAFKQWQAGKSPQAALAQQRHRDALTLLFVLAVLPVLMFLPLSSRLYYYSIPAVPPLAMIAGNWWSVIWQGQANRARVGVGWLMTGLGVAIASGLLWLPQRMIAFFPELTHTDGVQTIVTVQLIGLSVGFIGSGTFLLRKQVAIALVLLWFGFGTTWACVIQGFKTVQDFRSAKTLVLEANKHLQSDALWIFEGSRELGAAGAMGFYLNPNGITNPDKITTSLLPPSPKPSPKLNSNFSFPAERSYSASILQKEKNQPGINIPLIEGQLPSDWVKSPAGKVYYKTLLVLTDGGRNRLPPEFPGPKPSMLIDKTQMNQYWTGDRPTVFVTDFLRQPHDPHDPLTLNLPKDPGAPLLEIGPRKLYGNAIARALWTQTLKSGEVIPKHLKEMQEKVVVHAKHAKHAKLQPDHFGPGI